MKTQSLIEMLAKGAGPAPQAPVLLRLAPVVALGLIASALFALVSMGPIPAVMWATQAPWLKLMYGACLALAAGWLTARLSRPVARTYWPVRAVLAVFSSILALGALTLVTSAPDQRMAALFGETWLSCPTNVVALSLPALAGALWALRGLAPTQLRAAGFNAGLLAGALGAMGYSLVCPEVSATFVAVWYSLGILLTGLLGAVLGPRLLRW
ncbi:NrsF family protein [Hydrogenophaga sp.]|uniref:NrsF family protein n=1 Tax=Hydrogenophaga sp. TaxID=1904254 RepID=UPI003D0D365C